MNKTKLANYIQVAQTFAQRSPDSQTKVGSILVHKHTGAIMGMAFNGFVRDANDSILPTTRPKKHDYIVHAEVNLICNIARHNINISDCFVVCTLSPCINCMRILFQAGIDEIYFKDTYRDFTKNLNMDDLTIDLTAIGDYTKIRLRGSKK